MKSVLSYEQYLFEKKSNSDLATGTPTKGKSVTKQVNNNLTAGTPKGKSVKKDWKQFLKDAVSAGVGEVVLNAVDRDGTMQGMDLDLINQGASSVKVPLVAVGGVSSLSDIKQAIEAGASAVSAGAFFVFQGPHRAVLITYPQYKELEEFLK